MLDPMDLAANFLHKQAPLFRGMPAIFRKLGDFLADQIEIQRDRTERVADLVGHPGGHGADGGKTLGLEPGLLSPRAVGYFLPQRRRSQLHLFFEVVVRHPKRRQQENHADEQNQQHQRVPIQDGPIGVRVAHDHVRNQPDDRADRREQQARAAPRRPARPADRDQVKGRQAELVSRDIIRHADQHRQEQCHDHNHLFRRRQGVIHQLAHQNRLWVPYFL